MLRKMKEIEGNVLAAKDGEIGRCRDFLFDDQHWTCRYMVADTGKWLPGKRVLISPIFVDEPQWSAREIPVAMTKQEIEEAPPLRSDAPISRRYEKEWFDHYALPYYWIGSGLWGPHAHPAPIHPGRVEMQSDLGEQAEEIEATHLRSAGEVAGYRIRSRDGEIGHVEDFLIDSVSWRIHYVVVNTRNWLPGRKVLVSTAWFTDIDWAEKEVSVEMTREEVRTSPELDETALPTPEYEARLHEHYGRENYWI